MIHRVSATQPVVPTMRRPVRSGRGSGARTREDDLLVRPRTSKTRSGDRHATLIPCGCAALTALSLTCAALAGRPAEVNSLGDLTSRVLAYAFEEAANAVIAGGDPTPEPRLRSR